MMKSPIVVALIHPLNILMAGLAVFAGLVSAWWLFPIGAIFWLVMGVLKPKVQGRADMSAVSARVKARLGG